MFMRLVYGIGILTAVLLVAGAVWLGWSFHVISHDYSVNEDWQRLVGSGPPVPNSPQDWKPTPPYIPLREVVPAHNRWTEHAFIAEPRAPDDLRAGDYSANALILDDHSLTDDPLFTTGGYVVGELTDRSLLCRVPQLAAAKQVQLDRYVATMIRARCHTLA
jgi:hypothetical protein